MIGLGSDRNMVITQIGGLSHFFIADCLKNNEIGMIEIPLQSNGNGADQIIPRGIFEHFHPKRRQKQETCEDLGWLGGDNFLWDMTFIFFFKTSDGVGWLGGGDFFIIFILFIYSNLLLPPKIIRKFCPKMAILPQNMASWARIGPAGSFGALLVGGCGARAVSRKTRPFCFMFFIHISFL